MRYFLKKYEVLLSLAIASILILIATLQYAGGTIQDKNTIGFDWSRNFFSNLFQENSLNGLPNLGRICHFGMIFYSLGNGVFFINMSKKISDKQATLVLKIVGYSEILFNFLIATPLHDSMVAITSTLTLLGLFYITIFSFRTSLHLLKIGCVLSMLVFYYTLFLYGTGNWGLLAIMQKVTIIGNMLLVISIEHFVQKEDFHLK
jgi:hypothetical protein